MTITTFTSSELNQDITRAKKAANAGSVFITNRGKPEHVLLNLGEYRHLTGEHRTLADALSMLGLADIEFDPPKVHIESRNVEF